MPLDKEIHFAVIGYKNVFALAERLGVEIINYDNEPITADTFDPDSGIGIAVDCTQLDKIDQDLAQAWIDVITDKGWTVKAQDRHYYDLDTEYGHRKATAFNLELQYDIYEVGDEPQDMTLGVGLSSRYFPRFLDMNDEHGTLGTAVDVGRLSVDIEKAKAAIVARVSELADCTVVYRDIFY